MTTLTIKNIPPDLYERLKHSAEVNRRSINSEVLMCIERSLLVTSLDPTAALSQIRALREKTRRHLLTDTELTSIKDQGRM